MSPRRAAVLLCACLAPAALADTYPRQAGVDAVHYEFRLELRDTSDTIDGETTLVGRFVKDGLAEIALDLVSAADGKGMQVASVASGTQTLAFTHLGDRLTVKLPSRRGPDATSR